MTKTLRMARDTFFAEQGIPTNTYEERWAKIDFFGLPLWLPNSEERARSLRLHDMHHMLTGYQTDILSEAEIGAWELATGCRDHYVAWVLNAVAVFGWGWLIPRRVIAAWRRGCRSLNLYYLRDEEFEALLDVDIEEVRKMHRLDT